MLIALVTLLRLVAPLDVAPFLLYLPILFFVGLSAGRGPGFVGLVTSAAMAACFFVRADESTVLTSG